MNQHHHWLDAEGTILDAVQGTGHNEYNYAIEVRRDDGTVVRKTVRHREKIPYDVGMVIRAEIRADNSEIRFHHRYHGADSIISMPGHIGEATAAFFGTNLSTPTVFVVDGNGGGGAMDLGDVARLTQAAMSGDPDAQRAAIDGFRQLKAAAARQMGDDHQNGPGRTELRLSRLQQLLDSGTLTQAEYDSARQRILNDL